MTNTLRNALADAGWTGLRYVNENTRPEDFQEGTFGNLGLDVIYADAARLSVYAGHGASGQLQWGSPSPSGQCRTTIPTESRFGSLAGDTAAAVMLLASCTMRVDQLWPVYKSQMSRQIFGYHNSPYVGPHEARKVFSRTQDGQWTADAWLEEMVLNGLGKNSPLVFTKGLTLEEAMALHGATNLASGAGFIKNVAEPAFSYWFELYDSGCSKVCGGCSGNAAAPPEITVGSEARLVELTRPTRSAGDLVERVSAALTLFGVVTLEADEQARLRAWAVTAASRGDITYGIVVEDPQIDVSYDPETDFLRITNRDALARARPRPGQPTVDPSDLPTTLLNQAEGVFADVQSIHVSSEFLDTQFEKTTRIVGYGQGNAPPTLTAIEYMFTRSGVLEGLALPDRHLGIGLTRLGELSTLTLAEIEVEVIGSSKIERQPQQAIADLTAWVFAEHPDATDIEVVEPKVGYQLGEAETSALTVPSLLVGYAVQFGEGDEAVASRRFPVRISLVEPDAPIESLTAVDPDPNPGDERGSN